MRFSHPVLEELSGLLSKTVNPSSEYSPQQLAEKLFHKAPLSFLEKSDASYLERVVGEALAALESWHKNSVETYIKHFTIGESSTLFIVSLDRPFLVRTIENCLIDFRVSSQAILHPILKYQGKVVSLSVVDLGDTEVSEALQTEITTRYSQVAAVVKDHAAMLDVAERAARITEKKNHEGGDFIRWLVRNNFVFLGAISDDKYLGLCSPSFQFSTVDKATFNAINPIVSTRSLAERSPVHHKRRLLHIRIKENDQFDFIGFFSSRGMREEPSLVPLIREKLLSVFEREEVEPNSYDYKQVIEWVQGVPKSALLNLSEDSLLEQVRLVNEVHFLHEPAAKVQIDPASEGIWIFLALPQESFDNSLKLSIENLLESFFSLKPGSIEAVVSSINDDVVRIHNFIPYDPKQLTTKAKDALEKELSFVALGWFGSLTRVARDQDELDLSLLAPYRVAFSKDYQALTTPLEALSDIKHIEQLTDPSQISCYLSQPRKVPSGKVFPCVSIVSHSSPLELNMVLPVMERFGLLPIQAEPFEVRLSRTEQVFIQRIVVKVDDSAELSKSRFAEQIAPAIISSLRGETPDDPLNTLVVRSTLSAKQVHLLRTITQLLWQIRKIASRQGINEAIIRYPEVSSQLWDIFDTKFNPQLPLPLEQRKIEVTNLLEKYRDSLRGVTDITEDRILRSLASIIDSMVRTNFYLGLNIISHKIDTTKLDLAPNPKPYFETFISSPNMEGTHLRLGPVARGGIRWSERKEDYRTEVLGLAKTQRIKNALVVPTGAKGGFIVRDLPTDRKLKNEKVLSCYREYIRGLLYLADNKVNGETVHPSGLIIYDLPDPYLVVAADKGTASFSDVANTLAIEDYGFWLDDAFASGGSHGYSHKGLGITARGAWETTKQHFYALGRDPEKEPLSVIGIGDMSGDVFGNGLLLSRSIKLIGAFNHAHIFVDPTPDPTTSYQERKRLFELPTSQWTDYAPNLISAGGGVFNRFDKSITLSKEIKAFTGYTSSDPVSGEYLITLLLKSKCDLIWNGGIGTYFRSSKESDADVNDGANDRVRISAKELRSQVVTEGGNLGFTQEGRIEYAKNGGRINTDALDNSAGVDLSDHEVNLKLFYQSTFKLNKDVRDKELLEVAPEVIDQILLNNRYQALSISIAEKGSKKSLDYFKQLLRTLVEASVINRSDDHLPEEDELDKRASLKSGLSRPELAVLLAANKIWVKGNLSQDEALIGDVLVDSYLHSYFPEQFRERYKDSLEGHPLAKEIALTECCNRLLDIVGITFIHRVYQSQSCSVSEVFGSVIAAIELLGIRHLLQKIDFLYGEKQYNDFLNLYLELGRAVRDVTSWLLNRFRGHNLLPSQLVAQLDRGIIKYADRLIATVPLDLKDAILKREAYCTELGIQKEDSRRLALLPLSCLHLQCSLENDSKLDEDFFQLLEASATITELCGLSSILGAYKSVAVRSHWEHELLLSAVDDMRQAVVEVGKRAIKKGLLDRHTLSKTLQKSRVFIGIRGIVLEFHDKGEDVAILPAISRQLLALRFS